MAAHGKGNIHNKCYYCGERFDRTGPRTCPACKRMWRQINYVHRKDRGCGKYKAERAARLPELMARFARGEPLFPEVGAAADSSNPGDSTNDQT